MTARRSTGVTLAGIVTLLGSALLLLFAVFTLFAAFRTPPPNSPPFLKGILLGTFSIEVAFAVWGIATGIGLFLLRVWSRWSMVTFSVLLTFIGGSAALSTAFVAMPETRGVSAPMMAGMKFGLVGFYAILTFLGAFWLYYFNAARVRAQFGAELTSDEPGGRPLSIAIISWFLIIGGVVCVGLAPFRFPAMAFAITLTGWPASAFYLLFGLLELWAGIGLLRLKPLSRVLAMGIFAYGFVSTLLFAVLPGFSERMQASADFLPAGMRGTENYAAFAPSPEIFWVPALVSAVPLWFLVARRGVFQSK